MNLVVNINYKGEKERGLKREGGGGGALKLFNISLKWGELVREGCLLRGNLQGDLR